MYHGIRYLAPEGAPAIQKLEQVIIFPFMGKKTVMISVLENFGNCIDTVGIIEAADDIVLQEERALKNPT